MLLVYLGCTSAALPQDPNDEETTYDAGTTVEIDTGLVVIVTPSPTIDAGTDAASGCADGTREGFPDQANVATCAGQWTGDVANGVALCAAGWRVCDGSEASFKALTYDQANAVVGCFAVNASDDHGDCHHGCAKAVADGVDDALNVDMAGVGSLPVS